MLSISAIFKSKQAIINESQIRSKAQAQLLGENTANLIYAADESMISISSIIAQKLGGNKVLQPEQLNFIQAHILFLPQVQNLLVLDMTAKPIYSVKSLNGFKLPSFEEFQTAWLESAIETAYESQDKALMLLSRRLENQDRDFTGVLVAVIDTGFFLQPVRRIFEHRRRCHCLV